MLIALWSVACAGPTTSTDDYRGKVAQTAQSMRSLLATARLAADGAAAGSQTSAFTSVIFGEVEEDASAVQAGFASRQPPGPEGDELRSGMDPLLSESVSTLADLRIAARRGDGEAMGEAAADLGRLRRSLLRYQQVTVT